MNKELEIERKKFTDEEIHGAMIYCRDFKSCNINCPFRDKYVDCAGIISYYSLDLINRQKAENEDLYYKLRGVMHFVDKWLDGDELKQDEVQRADTMREKTLQITEKQTAEIERLQNEVVDLQKRIVFWREDLNYQPEKVKSEAIKEFAEKLKEVMQKWYCDFSLWQNKKQALDIIDNLVKEMVGE